MEHLATCTREFFPHETVQKNYTWHVNSCAHTMAPGRILRQSSAIDFTSHR
ncbi:hypothetical protein O181_039208, partial [Austropuccinia psidii MF-1]|nr:hypothetical protein [Austropuccinia psidii MF-1]